MRVVWLWAALAGLLAALTGPPGAGGPLSLAHSVLREHPEIWSGAEVVQGERSVVIGRVGSAGGPGLAGLSDLARRADRAALTVAGVAGPVRPLILVPATTEQAARLAAPAAVSGLAAVAGTDRVIIEPRSFARLTGAGRDVVLAHELTHVATGAAADGRTPKWLIEGFADYVGYLGTGIPVASAAAELGAEVRAGRVPGSLPGSASFAAGSARLAQAYEEAWLACRYVAGRFGERALVTLYRESMRSDPRTALGRALGMTTEEFTAAWREYVRRELAWRG
ncbi:hypothetical protein AB0O34_32035 [Sphaerisporangium sp. NPDC088356]|uniref:hypothetical protein n=1 Tax=Sphaerisporangium sp. NPDC088356 TaxID=3154871 RepID=UPI0034127E3C